MANGKKATNKKIWASVLLAVLGIGLIIGHTATLPTIIRILGIALLVIGAVGVIQQVMDKEGKNNSKVLRVLLNVIVIGLGIWVLASPGFFEGTLKFLIGTVILIYAIKDLFLAIQEKKHWFFLLIACVSVVLGILLMLLKLGSDTFAIFAGIALAYTGIASAISELKGKKA